MSYATVAQLRQYLPQNPEYGQQTITGGGGAFTLTYEGATTASLVATATASTVQSALRGLAGIGTSGVNVQGPPGGPWVASFQGQLATNAALLAASGATIAPTTNSLLQSCLDRATETVRGQLRALLADPTFDWAAWPSASTKIVTGVPGEYLYLPSHQAASVSLVEYMSATNPVAYTTITDQWLEEDGRLWRAAGWLPQRYRVTAAWGYGPTVPAQAAEVVLELAVNIWRSRDKGGFSEVVGVEGSSAMRVVAGLTKQQQATLVALSQELGQLWL
jgi:phosphoribosylcarboxyaminoimidazole (NCAIR) mutase